MTLSNGNQYLMYEHRTHPLLSRAKSARRVARHLMLALLAFAVLVPICAHAIAGSSSPMGLAFDRSGNLFVADVGSGAIFKFTSDGTQSTFASGLAPEDLVFDGSGNLFVSDAASGSILKFTPDGKKSTFAREAGSPIGVAFDGAGNLFVSDHGSSGIFKFTSDGKKSTVVTKLNNPLGVACDSSQNLFVAASWSGAILKFTPAGVQSTFVSDLGMPYGVTFDRSGNLFVADGDKGTIFKFTPDGIKSSFASGLSSPTGLAVDGAGNLFVSDRKSGTIFKFAPDGTKSTFASGFALQAVKFPSPDGKFALRIDKEGKPAIIEQESRKSVLELESFREDEDKMVWSPDSKRMAYCHRGNKTTEAKVFFWDGAVFNEVELPDLPEVELKIKPPRNPHAEQHVHFDHDTIKPLRWLKSGALVFSREKSETDTTAEEVTYAREFIITVSFDAKHRASIQNVTKQAQKVELNR